MRKLACILIVFVFLCSTFLIGNVHASTPISGIITSDTTWTTGQSPIQFTGAVCIASGVTVTVEPGVTVDFCDYYLQVNGTLNARGTSSNKIVFMATTDEAKWLKPHIDFTPASTSWNDATGTGSIVENAQFVIVNINIDGCSPKISSSTFFKPRDTPINAKGGAAQIVNNYFDNKTARGISAYGSTLVDNNVFLGIGYNIPIICGDNAVISNNKITSCYSAILTTSGQVTIKGNSLVNNSAYGVASQGNSNIQLNYICGSDDGIVGSGNIQNNTIINNKVGVRAPTGPVNYNNIYGNSFYNLYSPSSGNVDATNNWWGTTDNQIIEQSIYQGTDDYTWGQVTHMPFLNAPNPSAPSSPEIGDLPNPPLATSEPNVTPQTQTSQHPQQTPNSSNNYRVENPSGTSLGFDYNILIVAVIVIGVVWIVLIVAVIDRRLKSKVNLCEPVKHG